MSKYENISKQIGWEPRRVTIPSVEDANTLKRMVIERYCTTSFKRVFEIHRFAPSASNDAEFEAMKIVFEAFSKGTEIFIRYHN